jgi:mRNA-degrading endonuclease toxin of MazEF toxin-antitoxin module
VITCDNIVTLPKGMFASSRVGHLSHGKRAELDHALRYALDIQY